MMMLEEREREREIMGTGLSNALALCVIDIREREREEGKRKRGDDDGRRKDLLYFKTSSSEEYGLPTASSTNFFSSSTISGVL